MVLRSVLDFLVPLLWLLIAVIGISYLWIVGRKRGIFTALRRLFSYRVLWPVLAVMSITVVSASLVFIDPREVGVVVSLLNKDGIRERPLNAGLHWVVPLAEKVVRYPIVMQSYTMSYRPTEGDKLGDDAIRARTSDGQLVIIDVTALFRIDRELAVQLHIDWQDRYIRDFIRPGLRAFVRSQASKFTVDEINSHKRKAFEDALNELARSHCEGTGIMTETVLVRNITFSDEYGKSVEQKMTALQRVTEAEYKARQVANLSRGDAEKIKIKAKAEANAVVVLAEADAEAVVVKAKAEAEALSRIARALEDRDNLLTYRYIDKLSPNIKAMLLPNNAPLILPMPELDQQQANVPAKAMPAEHKTLPPKAPKALPKNEVQPPHLVQQTPVLPAVR